MSHGEVSYQESFQSHTPLDFTHMENFNTVCEVSRDQPI